MAIRLLVVDANFNHGNAVKEYFKNSSSIEVVNVVDNKEDAYKYLTDSDVILIDLLLSGVDSMMILSRIKEMGFNKKVIATSDIVTNDMMRDLNHYNINYFIKKPYSLDSLAGIIENLYVEEKVTNNNEIRVQITNMLHSLGIPSHIKGYAYLRDGVEKLYNDESLIGAITKELYPSIAEVYNTTSSRVERAIRHAIEVSWVRGDYHLMEELFGNSVDYDRSKPTNSEFLVTLADRLKIDSKYV